MSDKLSISERLQHGWNAFRNKDPSTFGVDISTVGSSYSPSDRRRKRYSIDSTMVDSIFTKIAIDASAATFEHIRTDENGGYVETIDSGLNSIFNLEANIDQTGREFLFDVITSMFDDGVVACVPIDTKSDPSQGISGYDILTMRTGKIVNWWPEVVAVELYNDRTGQKETIKVPKKSVAIITNPFYSVMNESNSTLRRLNKRFSLLDAADDRAGSSKLDMIIQLPYSVKNSMREATATKRRDELINQLHGSEYGVAYMDSTEKIIQLNRPVENNLTANIEYLTNLLFEQLGISPEIMNMTASEQVMTNYYRRMIDPIDDAIVDEFKRKFLTKTAMSQRQTIWHYNKPFQFTPTSALADIADKMVRNEVLTSNELRGVIGYKPSNDPRANQLVNPNMPQPQTASGVDEFEEQSLGSLPISSLLEE